MRKIICTIDKKTGVMTIRTEGYSGAECLAATKELRARLGITAEPVLTPEFYAGQAEDQTTQAGA